LTNTLDPDEGGVRIAMFAAIAAMLIASLAAPRAFGRDGVTFAIAYLVVRALHLQLFALAGRGDPDLLHAVLRILPSSVVGTALLLTAGVVGGTARIWCWGIAVAAEYAGALFGHMRGWRVSPHHFVERFGQIFLIALGESIVAIGVGASGLPLDAGEIGAALLGITIGACIWWSYFDWVVIVAEARLTAANGRRRAVLARDLYSYLHLPMVAGIVLYAFGLKTALHNPTDSLGAVAAVGLVAGVALYLLAHVAVRLRIGGGIGRGRPIAAAALLVSLTVAAVVPALVALGVVAAVCVALITYEAIRHREERALIRGRHGDLTSEERAQYARPPRTTSRRRERS
jgi:low temperature requirement protein LtrA